MWRPILEDLSIRSTTIHETIYLNLVFNHLINGGTYPTSLFKIGFSSENSSLNSTTSVDSHVRSFALVVRVPRDTLLHEPPELRVNKWTLCGIKPKRRGEKGSKNRGEKREDPGPRGLAPPDAEEEGGLSGPDGRIECKSPLSFDSQSFPLEKMEPRTVKRTGLSQWPIETWSPRSR